LTIRDAAADDFAAICALNLADVQHTSAMDLKRLGELHGLSVHHRVGRVDGAVAAFLLAMSGSAAYNNDNFKWFAQRYRRFLYVDRIVVSAACRGMGVGSMLYEDLFRRAREEGYPMVTCEYNMEPPNELSRAFHDKFGFTEQGTQWVASGTKRVSLQVAEVAR
jgi:predicted GNAT superfamily acetyltransferase